MAPHSTLIAASGLFVVLCAMTLLWLISLRLKDASIVDPFWGPGFALAALSYYVVDGRYPDRGTLVLALVTLWATRLALHLYVRNRREGEDPRYTAMREARGKQFPLVSLFTIFWFQAFLLWVISSPILGSIVSQVPLGFFDFLGAIVFLIGLTIESIADNQLAVFRATPSNKGHVLDSGLWRYSRHPNYFGDAVLWWGLYLIAVGAEAYWTIVGPVLITLLLLRFSGVPMLEEGLRTSRPGYSEYIKRTSSFVPWPPKK
jgi:steroid 5-alpha reductase family enzyme